MNFLIVYEKVHLNANCYKKAQQDLQSVAWIFTEKKFVILCILKFHEAIQLFLLKVVPVCNRHHISVLFTCHIIKQQ